MKHIKKYRKVLSRKEQENLRNKARQRAKTILINKFKEEYLKIYTPIYKKLRRDLIFERKL